MFFNKTPRRSAKSETLATLIDATVRIEGQIRFDKSARIDGRVRGNVTGSDAKKGMLIIGPEAIVEGDVACHSVVVLGKIQGTLTASYVELRASAHITGDVHYEVIEVHQGSDINGRLFRQQGHEATETPEVPQIDPQADRVVQAA